MSTIAERRAIFEAAGPLVWTSNLGADKPVFHAYDKSKPDTSHVDLTGGSFVLCQQPANLLLSPLHAKHAARIGTPCPDCFPNGEYAPLPKVTTTDREASRG